MEKCFSSTPNLKFMMASPNEPDCLESVCMGYPSLAEGMPLVWVAKRLSIPICERVSGAESFDRLRHLGAVINFVAGNIKRAPLWLRRLGLEWVWRAREESSSARGYLQLSSLQHLTVLQEWVHVEHMLSAPRMLGASA
jgi:UDP-N-acetyl-D-mannosaminuronic acid transferase (WecB/TagA/CpsF family)